jgi:hypothetical protein
LSGFVSAAGAQWVAQINFPQFRSKPNAVGGGSRSSPNGAARAADAGRQQSKAGSQDDATSWRSNPPACQPHGGGTHFTSTNYGGVSKKFPLPSHYIPLQQGYPVTQQHLHINVGISASEPIVTHGFNVHDLAVVFEGSEVRDNCNISA